MEQVIITVPSSHDSELLLSLAARLGFKAEHKPIAPISENKRKVYDKEAYGSMVAEAEANYLSGKHYSVEDALKMMQQWSQERNIL